MQSSACSELFLRDLARKPKLANATTDRNRETDPHRDDGRGLNTIGLHTIVFIVRGMDTQTLELIGQHRLAGELLRAGLEVAFPARDRGVDLIAYADINQRSGQFVAKPIQLKAASRRSFGIWKKYEKIHGLIFAFVWHLDGETAPETYALSYAESLKVGDLMGWTEQMSWTKKGAYDNTNPGVKLRELLKVHQMDRPEKWHAKISASD